MGPRTISGDPVSLVAAELRLVDAGVGRWLHCNIQVACHEDS